MEQAGLSSAQPSPTSARAAAVSQLQIPIEEHTDMPEFLQQRLDELRAAVRQETKEVSVDKGNSGEFRRQRKGEDSLVLADSPWLAFYIRKSTLNTSRIPSPTCPFDPARRLRAEWNKRAITSCFAQELLCHVYRPGTRRASINFRATPNGPSPDSTAAEVKMLMPSLRPATTV